MRAAWGILVRCSGSRCEPPVSAAWSGRTAARLGAGGLLLIITLAACSRTPPPPKQFELTGQILAIKPERQEVLLKHGDIKGFMPAMTMPYKVQDASLLTGKEPGDMIRATLVVGEVDAHLSSMTKTGHAALESPPATTDLPNILEPGAQVPDALLIDQDGKPTPFSKFRGHRVALTFIYTRCPLPDFCPLMDRNFATVQAAVAKTPKLSDVRLVTITLDPAFDTPTVLKPHAQALNADAQVWSFMTGEPAEVTRFSSAFGIDVEADQQHPDQIIHNLRTAVIDADGRLVKVQSGNSWTPAQLVADLSAAPAPRN
jgi:protein SCO1/2